MNEPTKAEYLPIDKLHPFEGHPFKVIDNEEMDRLVWSVVTQGVLTPLVVRPMENGEYEVISGHRRLYACQKAEIDKVPALIYALDRDAAAIALVDSNLHREHILPSEKAFAYKLKADALNHQGQRTDLTSVQVAPKLSTDVIAQDAGTSKDTVKRYIRLTNLQPPILQMVDEGKIALTPAVELSYLKQEEQLGLVDAIEANDCTPSLSQAIQMKKLSQENLLTKDRIDEITSQEKANQREKISFRVEDIRGYFPRGYTSAQMVKEILQALQQRQRRRKGRDLDGR